MRLEELQVLISADIAQFKGEIQKVQKQLSDLQDTTKNVTKNAGTDIAVMTTVLQTGVNVIGKVLGSVTDAFGSFTQSLVENGSAYARIKVSTETVARNMGLTREQVDELRSSLAESNTYGTKAEEVIRTLATSGLMKMADSLKVVDARTGEMTTGVGGLVLAMKDLGASAGVDSSVAIDGLTKFIRRGEVTFAESMIQVGNMAKEYEAFANSIGKSRMDLTAQEEAQARFNIVIRESQKAFGAYANTMFSSGKAFASVRDASRSTMELLGSALEPALRAWSNGMLQLVFSVREAVIGSQQQLQAFASKVAGIFVAMFRVIGMLLSRLPIVGKYFEGLAKFSMKSGTAVDSLSASVDGASGSMNNASGSAKKLKKELAGLASFDEMNILTQQADSGSGGGGGGGIGGGFDAGTEPQNWEIDLGGSADEINKFADSIIEALKPYKELIIGISAGLGILTAFAGIMLGIAGTMKIWGIVGATASKVFLAIISPVGLTVLGITALIGVLILLYTQFQSVRDLFASVGELISGVFSVALQLIVDLFMRLWNEILMPMFAWIQTNLVPVFDQIIMKINEMVQFLVTQLPVIQQALQPVIQVVGDVLVKAFQLLGSIVDWLWKTILKPLIDFILANIVPAFKFIVGVVIEVIKVFADVTAFVIGLLMPILEGLWNVIKTVFTAISEIVGWFWNNIFKPIFTELWNFINGFIIPIFQLLFIVGQKIFNDLKGAIQRAWDGIWGAIKPVVDWINTYIMPIVDKVAKAFTDAWEGVKSSANTMWEGIKGFFKSGVNGVIDVINGMINGINKALEGADELAKNSTFGAVRVSYRVGKIPRLARGGVIDSPTYAMIGEAGKEAVMPLENNTGWITELANKINIQGGGGGVPLQVNIGGEVIFEKFIDYVNDKSMATNSVIMNI